MNLFENIKLLEDTSIKLSYFISDTVSFNGVNIDTFEKAEYLISLFPRLKKNIIDSYLKNSTSFDIPPEDLLDWIEWSNCPCEVISHAMFISKEFFLENVNILAPYYDIINKMQTDIDTDEIRLYLKSLE